MPEALHKIYVLISEAAVYLIIALITGGFEYWRQLRYDGIRFRVSGLFFSVTSSGIAGLMIYLLCVHFDFNDYLTGFFCGIAGSSGWVAVRLFLLRAIHKTL